MSTVKATNFSHPSAASPAIVLDAAGGATVAGMGLVLVSPTSIANSGGSASASGGAVTFTGVSSVSLNGVFTSAYENYRAIVDVSPSGTDPDLFLRFRTSGSDQTASNYQRQRLTANSTTVDATRATDDKARLVGMLTNVVHMGSADIYKPQLTTITGLFINWTRASTSIDTQIASVSYSAATAFDGLTLYAGSGNITGTIRVYGYKNS